jgi:tetratricopeptide (TPR) repeat protein
LLCIRTAQHYEKDGRVEDAIKLYEKARTTDPATANQAGRRLAVLYDKFGDFTKSTAEYEAQLQLAPNDAELLTDFGYSHYCRGDWTNAEATLKRAVQIDPKQKRAWVNLGLAQAQQSKWDESFHSFSNAVRPADAQSNIAFVMASQGRNAEAKERYRAALSLDPSHKVAQAGLRTLEKPPAKGEPESQKADEKFDAEAAAAKVPSIAEIEARIKGDPGHSPVVLPTPSQKTPEP